MTKIIRADLANPTHGQALVQLLREYAQDPMGGGQDLPAYTREHLVAELRERSSAHVLLATDGDAFIGLANCMEGFSTFACKPLLNIHDIVVTKAHRGRGVGKLLLARAEELALSLGCCKLTLEVLEDNHPARGAYQAFGFEAYALDPQMGRAMFWEKKLPVR
ncbi:MAG: GNAT family N-acetyltransferase [Ectothiorhodospiraceae bacterium]|nr:GNAT family N-acetyltransferase [Ectothiorhodospiraceae bacterium]MCH8503274.1 GNAT family N-acetyltransferase [Ectothiorhodospiraceae bacterium]